MNVIPVLRPELDQKFAEIEKMLLDMGGFWNLADIWENIHTGGMQSFTHNGSWLVTQVCDFPRKRVLDVVFVYGKMQDMAELENQLEAYKEKIGAAAILGTGRTGWKSMVHDGWRVLSVNYIKE